MYSFRTVTIDEFEQHPIRQKVVEQTIFQSPGWLRFLKDTQNGDPVLLLVMNDADVVGYFTGMLQTKVGVRILGSPFPGWSTGYMGFTLPDGVCHRAVLESFIPWAFENLHCVHMEVMDRFIAEEEVESMGIRFRREQGFEIDLTLSEDELFTHTSYACKKAIRKAIRSGLTVEEARDPRFVEDYYTQVQEVFGRRRLVPTFPRKRVAELLRRFGTDRQCLFLRTRNIDGQCIATAIMVGGGEIAYFGGAASLREHQILRPNDLLYWTVIQLSKKLGFKRLDMGGAGDYKARYGGSPIAVPWFQVSRFAILPKLRSLAQSSYGLRQRMLGRLAHHAQIP